MSNLINRLNAKTNSFDGVGVKNIHAVTASDVAAALSFSQMSELSHDLIRAKFLNENSVDKIEHIAIKLMQAHYPAELHSSLLKVCAVVAVIEFCRVPADYKPSVRNRALMCGVAKTTYCRLNLSNIIGEFIQWVAQYYDVGRAKLGKQFASLRHGWIYSEGLNN